MGKAANLSFRKPLLERRPDLIERRLTESRAVGVTSGRRLCQVQRASGEAWFSRKLGLVLGFSQRQQRETPFGCDATHQNDKVFDLTCL